VSGLGRPPSRVDEGSSPPGKPVRAPRRRVRSEASGRRIGVQRALPCPDKSVLVGKRFSCRSEMLRRGAPNLGRT
jgi:hypothetical protein